MKFWTDEEEVTILDGEVRDHSESSFLRYIKIRGIYFWSRACKVIEQFKSMRFKRNYFISVWSIMQELCCFCGYDRALCCWKIRCKFYSKQYCPSWNNFLWKQKFKNAWKIIYSLPYLKHYMTVWCALSFGTNYYQAYWSWISLNLYFFSCISTVPIYISSIDLQLNVPSSQNYSYLILSCIFLSYSIDFQLLCYIAYWFHLLLYSSSL